MNVETTVLFPKPEKENPAARRNLVTFRLGQQTCALPIELIDQIIPMITITPIPQVNHTMEDKVKGPALSAGGTSVVEGIIDVRGQVIPVINLRPRLGLRKTALQLRTPILLVRNGKGVVGLIVDQVIEVLSLSVEHVADFADFLPRGKGLQRVPILQGVAYIDNGAVLLLNLHHLSLPSQDRALAHAAMTLPEVNIDQVDVGFPPTV